MKRILVLAGLCLTLAISMAQAKSYRVDRIESVVEPRPNGQLDVVETLIFRYKGSFTYAFRDIPLAPGQSIENLVVSERGSNYIETTSRSSGTYLVEKISQGVRVTWYYNANSESKTFIISYTANGFMRRYADVTDFYFKFVGDGWDRRIGEVVGWVKLPSTLLSNDDVQFWAHVPPKAPLNGRSSLEGDRLKFYMEALPARSYWEARVLFPADAFPDMAFTSQTDEGDAIRTQEAAWANKANQVRKQMDLDHEARMIARTKKKAQQKQVMWIALAMAIAGLAVWWKLWETHGRAYRVTSYVAPGELPADDPPAVVSHLMYRSMTPTALVGTMIDLASRGYLEITEEQSRKKLWFGREKTESDFEFAITEKPVSELRDYERSLLDFMLAEVGDGQSFRMVDVKKYTKKHQKEFLLWYKAWRKEIKKFVDTLTIWEPFDRQAMTINVSIGVAFVLLGVFALAKFRGPLPGMPIMMWAMLQLGLSLLLVRRTRDGQRRFVAWKAFRSRLSKMKKGMGPITLTSRDWSRYLAAAVMFNMHDQVIPLLQMDDRSSHGAYPMWYHGAAGLGNSANMSDLATGLSTMVTTVSSTMSSASGSGGGASGGGGGGAGGGGGGAG